MQKGTPSSTTRGHCGKQLVNTRVENLLLTSDGIGQSPQATLEYCLARNLEKDGQVDAWRNREALVTEEIAKAPTLGTVTEKCIISVWDKTS